MPSEISLYWWGPVAVIAVAIVAIGAVWFTRWVTDRLDKDRSRIHQHDTVLTTLTLKDDEHERRLDDHEADIKDLKGRRK